MDVESLSDAELRAQLESYGLKVGPFTPTTRGLYVKKLGKLLGANASAAMPVHASSNGDHVDEVPEEPTVEKQKLYPVLDEQPPRQRRKVQKEVIAPVENEEHESDYDGEESMRFLTEEEIQADLDRSRRGSPQPAKSTINISTVVYVLFIIVAIIFTFFLFENAAKDSGNKDIV